MGHTSHGQDRNEDQEEQSRAAKTDADKTVAASVDVGPTTTSGESADPGAGFFAGLDPSITTILDRASLGISMVEREAQRAKDQLRLYLEGLPRSPEIQELIDIEESLDMTKEESLEMSYHELVTAPTYYSGEKYFTFKLTPARNSPTIELFPARKNFQGAVLKNFELVMETEDPCGPVAEYLVAEYARRKRVNELTAGKEVQKLIETRIREKRAKLLEDLADVVRDVDSVGKYAPANSRDLESTVRSAWREYFACRSPNVKDFDQASPDLQRAFLASWQYRQAYTNLRQELVAGINSFAHSDVGKKIFSLISEIKRLTDFSAETISGDLEEGDGLLIRFRGKKRILLILSSGALRLITRGSQFKEVVSASSAVGELLSDSINADSRESAIQALLNIRKGIDEDLKTTVKQIDLAQAALVRRLGVAVEQAETQETQKENKAADVPRVDPRRSRATKFRFSGNPSNTFIEREDWP